jgi:hypothetical protein
VSSDHTISGDDVLVHVEITASMFNQCVHFLETAIIEQQFKAFTCRHFPTVVLGFNACLTASGLASSLPIPQVLESLFGA